MVQRDRIWNSHRPRLGAQRDGEPRRRQDVKKSGWSANRQSAADAHVGDGGTAAFATLSVSLSVCQSVSLAAIREKFMPKLHYKVVEHDGGWAYRLNDVFSEPFHDKAAALAAARRVAKEQHVPGDTTRIEYQDADGKWHAELSEGDDRPDVDVES